MKYYLRSLLTVISRARKVNNSGWLQVSDVHNPYILLGELSFRHGMPWSEWILEESDRPSLTTMQQYSITEEDWAVIVQYPSSGDTGRILCALVPQHCKTDGPVVIQRNKSIVTHAVFDDLTPWMLSVELCQIIADERRRVTQCSTYLPREFYTEDPIMRARNRAFEASN